MCRGAGLAGVVPALQAWGLSPLPPTRAKAEAAVGEYQYAPLEVSSWRSGEPQVCPRSMAHIPTPSHCPTSPAAPLSTPLSTSPPSLGPQIIQQTQGSPNSQALAVIPAMQLTVSQRSSPHLLCSNACSFGIPHIFGIIPATPLA